MPFAYVSIYQLSSLASSECLVNNVCILQCCFIITCLAVGTEWCNWTAWMKSDFTSKHGIIFSFFDCFEPAPTDSIVLGLYMEGEITNAEKSSRSQHVRLDNRNILRTKITILNVAFFIFKMNSSYLFEIWNY